jgi:hypothetical protein
MRPVAFGVVLVLVGSIVAAGGALAHADPYFTVRALCSGLTDGQIDTALGELDDNATILIDRPAAGRQQIQVWMEDQLRQNLRIEVVDIQPTQLADGYSVTWTTRMYREDWRRAGISVRSTTEQATIHNGRITRWTSSLAAELAPNASLPAENEVSTSPSPLADVLIGGVPLSNIPLTLVVLPVLLLLAGGGFGLQRLRRPRQARVERPERLASPSKR